MSEPGDSTRVAVSTTALRANLATLTDADVVDLRRDAYGHGLEVCWELAAAAGARRFVTDVDDLVLGGLRDAVATIEPGAVFGFPGTAAIPAMTVTGVVLLTKEVPAGGGVSYGYRFRASEDTRVALVTGGYGQGIVRALGGAASVRIGDDLLPIVGRVAMDVCVVDIRDADVVAGETVTFLGDPRHGAPSLAAWTSATGMRAGELTTILGERGHREYVS